MKRRILFAVLPSRSHSEEGIDTELAQELLTAPRRAFNVYGYRVMAMCGHDILSDDVMAEDDDLEFSIENLKEFAGLYVLAAQPISNLHELDQLPGMHEICSHFICHNKVIAIQHTDGFQIVSPRNPKANLITEHDIDDDGFAPLGTGIESFTRTVMDLIAAQLSEKMHQDSDPLRKFYADAWDSDAKTG